MEIEKILFENERDLVYPHHIWFLFFIYFGKKYEKLI